MNKTTKLSLIATLSMCLFACSSENDDYLQQGQTAIEQQDFNTAVIQLKNAVRQTPEDPNARYFLAIAYFNTGDASGAEKEFERALEYGYSPNDVIPYLTKLYQSKGNKKGIYKLVAKSKGVKPKVLAELKLSQAKTYVDSGEHEKAEAVLNELKAIPHSGEYGLLGLTYSFVIKNNIEAALSQLEQLLDQYPEQLEALRLKGKLLIASGKNSEAIQTLQAYTELNPQDYNSQMFLAKLYLEDKQPERVLAIVNPLVESFPQAIEPLSLKANALIEQGEFSEALAVAEQVVLLNSEDVPARLMAGVSAYYSNDFATADKHLSIIAGLLPADHVGLRILADSQLKLGESVAANETIDMLSQTIFADGEANNATSQDALLLSQLGHSLVRDGQIKKAKSVLAKLPTDLEQPESLVNLGVLKLSLNDVSGIDDLELAAGKLEQNPAQLNNVLAMAYLKTGQYDKARAIADEFAEDESTKVDSEVLRAKIALLQGDKDAASSFLKNVAQIAPQNPALQLSNIMIEPATTESQAKERVKQLDELLVDFPTYIPAVIQHYGITKQFDLPRKMVTYLHDLLSTELPSREGVTSDAKLKTQLNITLANMLLSEGKTAEAISKLESIKQTVETELQSDLAVSKKAKHVLYQQLARAYIKNNEMPKAFDTFKTWYGEAPSHGPAVVGYVRALQAQNDIAKAYQVSSAFMNEVSEANPQVKVLHLQNTLLNQKLTEFDDLYEALDANLVQLPFVNGLYGHRLLMAQKPELALKHLEQAYSAIPSPRVTSLLGTSINAVKGEQALISFLKEHLSRHNNDELNALRYATLMTYKDNNEAIKYYRKVLEINNNNAVASNNLAHVYMTENNLNEALEFGENALRVAPNNANILDTVGMINLKIGNTERALELISKAVLEAKPQASDEMFVNYIEVLLVNDEDKLASRKMAERKVTDSNQAERLANLKSEYLKEGEKS